MRISDAYSYSYSYSYGNRDTYSDVYTQLHAWLVCGRASPDACRARRWRLFPDQWEVLCHGRPQC